jgi:hypothetical protein
MDIKIADRLNEPAIQRDFLLGLAQRGRCGAGINCVDLAAWKGNLSCVVCKMRSALREQHRRLSARNDRDEHGGRPDWPHGGDGRQDCRISVFIIVARDDVRIGERFRRIE